MLDPNVEPQHWSLFGECQYHPDIEFFPPRGSAALDARAVCLQCPVRWECLQENLASGHVGVWGGTTERQRRRLRKLPDFEAVRVRVLTEDTRLRQRIELGYGPMPDVGHL